MELKISAVICTHNRSEYLKNAIQSLINQNIPKERYEIIVVDNRSDDNTKEIVEQFSKDNTVRYLFEPDLGLCSARNTGWQNARGKYIAYLDDDAIAGPEWLGKIVEVFETVDPRPGCVGGKVDPVWEEKRPEWLSDRLFEVLAIVNWSDTPHAIKNVDKEWLVGTNIAIPRETIEDIGGFSPRLDRSGGTLLSNGDTFLERQIVQQGYSVYYHPDILVNHYVVKSRLTQSWFIRRYYWQGISNALMQLIEEKHSGFERVRMAAQKAFHFLRSPGNIRILWVKTLDPNEFTNKCLTYYRLGEIFGLLKGTDQ
jgi:glycosyltransferase involved in cell wall biosynthesis